MYHHHILTREDGETIKRVYLKQKEKSTKGDWVELLKHDFEFIGQEQIDEEIVKMSKSEYKEKVKKMINKASFKMFINLKNTHSKLDDIVYSQFERQAYLTSSEVSNFEKQLLFNLRSRCHGSKTNFKKMNSHNLKFILECIQDEDQKHTFFNCSKLINQNNLIRYENIFGTFEEQKTAIKRLATIEVSRNHIRKKHISPEGFMRQDPCTFDYLNGAAAVLQM